MCGPSARKPVMWRWCSSPLTSYTNVRCSIFPLAPFLCALAIKRSSHENGIVLKLWAVFDQISTGLGQSLAGPIATKVVKRGLGWVVHARGFVSVYNIHAVKLFRKGGGWIGYCVCDLRLNYMVSNERPDLILFPWWVLRIAGRWGSPFFHVKRFFVGVFLSQNLCKGHTLSQQFLDLFFLSLLVYWVYYLTQLEIWVEYRNVISA